MARRRHAARPVSSSTSALLARMHAGLLFTSKSREALHALMHMAILPIQERASSCCYLRTLRQARRSKG